MLSPACTAWAADRALVIGIDNYPAIGLDGALSQAEADAAKFAGFLNVHAGFAQDEITLLQGSDATAKSIMDILIEKLVGETEPGDRVVFYFAGLGSKVDSISDNATGGVDDVILAYDADTLLGKIPSRAISDILDIIADRDVTVVVDASFGTTGAFGAVTGYGSSVREVVLPGAEIASGGAAQATSVATASNAMADMPFGSGEVDRVVWNAAAPGQAAWENAGGGVFTSLFVDALKTGKPDTNENGNISNAELLSHLRTKTAEWCTTDIGCVSAETSFTPHFSGPVQDQTLPPTTKEPSQNPVLNEGPALVRVEEGAATLSQTLGVVTDLFTPSNDANLQLSINGSRPLKLGEIVSFAAESERSGTLIIFDVNPIGELVQLFPSALAPNAASRVKAGQPQVIPSALSSNGRPLRIRVAEPAGEGFLLAILVEDDLPELNSILGNNLDGRPVPNAGQYLYEIAQDLLQLQADDNGIGAVKWSAAYLPYQITR
jgi:hypothetical protein